MAEMGSNTDIFNETDCDFRIVLGDYRILVPRRRGNVCLNVNSDQVWYLPVLEFTGEGVPLKRVISRRDLFENETITISGDVGNSYFCHMTPRTDLGKCYGDEVNYSFESIVDLEKDVWIWPNQCKHLLKKCTEAMDRYHRATGGIMANSFIRSFKDIALVNRSRELLKPPVDSVVPLLRSCGDRSDGKAAFALSSLPACVPTFSKFALAIRDLDFAVDIVCCAFDLRKSESWEWCEKRCRLVYADCTNRLKAADEDSLEADVRRQNADREALLSSLDAKLSKSSVASSTKLLNPGTWFRPRDLAANLEAICLKRLQVSSSTSVSYSPADAFFIGNPDTSFVPVPGASSRRGGSKSVQKCKWLGETVALSTMWDIPKDVAQAETGILARVQHPNVVAWMGYAFKEDPRVETRYREFFLVTEFMECDLHDLITDKLTDDVGSVSCPPFPFPVAVDIALQIVEAMIHVHKCRVLHRDLKPKNILASKKGTSGHSWYSDYSIKLTDFGSSKRRDGDSHFDTRKQGTTLYMAPEVWESDDSYTWSADLYSFGLTCFEIFTGRLPFESDMPLSFAAIQEVMRGEIVFPYYFDYPAELKDLIQKCWSQNPDDRPRFEDIRKALWWLKLHNVFGL